MGLLILLSIIGIFTLVIFITAFVIDYFNENQRKKSELKFTKTPYTMVRVRQGYFELHKLDMVFSGYNGNLKFNRSDADKVLRFLNNFYKGHENISNKKVLDRIEEQLSVKVMYS